MTAALATLTSPVRPLPIRALRPNRFSVSLYGDPAAETDGLLESVRNRGVLVPLVVVRDGDDAYEIVSGHRRMACALILGMDEVPGQVVKIAPGEDRRRAVLDYNRQRRKTFSQMMREADALEEIVKGEARRRQWANLAQNAGPERPNSDARRGRTDTAVAEAIGLGGKDAYRQARAIWKAARTGDIRAQSGVDAIDAGTKTIHAAYKDLRRRDRFSAGFRPTPYDVWAFRHDRAFGVPHPGSIPPAIVAHALHYFTRAGDLVVDPMAGGGTTLDVCASMGRRCLAYDLHPVRPDIVDRDVKIGFTPDSNGCDLIFVDPPYHTMLARRYPGAGIGEQPLADWIAFLNRLAVDSFATLKPGGYIAVLLANQTERDLPAGNGYIDHAFLGYSALIAAGFVPERRISCPMDGAYLPQHVKRARTEGRMLGQVRDLLVMRKPSHHDDSSDSPAASS
ncbi:MAG: putative transcriptional regulator [Planctomycetota bacterium]|nr:putative transcriptional regulator [Planctomycetota bacterium]